MKKEIFLNFIFTVLTSMIMFLQNKYFIKYMGIETLGIMKLFSQLLQYLNIVEMGLGSASTFALYKPLAEKNYKQVSIILSTIKNTYNKIAILLFCLGILVIPTLPFFMKIKSFDKIIYFYWILYLLNTVSTYLFIKYVILFTANQEFIYVRFIQSMSKITYQILQIFLIIKYHSFILFIILLIVDNLTQYILFKKYFKKNYSFIFSTKEKYIGLNKDIKNLFWHKIGSLIVFNTDLILIAKFVSIEIVGIYASYQIIVQMIGTLIGIVCNVIRPKIGKFISQNSNEEIYLSWKKVNIIFGMLGVFFSICTFILINDFIGLWIGKEFVFPKITIILINMNVFILVFRGPIEIYKESYGFFNDIQCPIYESLINLIFSIILGMKLGLNGIILGTIISNITIILIYKPILVFKRCFDKDIKDYIRIYGNYLLLIIISILSCNFILKFVSLKNVNSWFDWIMNGVIVGSITFIITFAIFLSNKDFRDNLLFLRGNKK